ncbi:MAG: hypothetical protein P8N63_13130 [Pseudomonadales bacterium]|nr:hypothetical protein [Pseudomonadales bacterium]
MDSRLDLFESIFKRAQRISLEYSPPVLASVLVLVPEQPDAMTTPIVEQTLEILNRHKATTVTSQSLSNDIDELSISNLVLDHAPDLIVLQRHLLQGDHSWNRGFGGMVQSLIQHHATPILALPNQLPNVREPFAVRTVAAVVDQPLDNHGLVNWASTFCASGATLCLHHIEAEDQFERIMKSIERIPELNTETARTTLKRELMHEAQSFLNHCQLTLEQYRPDVTVQYSVEMTRVQHGYLNWITQIEPDLIVLDTLNATKALNRGIADALSLQFTDLPFLLL